MIMPRIMMMRSLKMTNYNQVKMPSYNYLQAYLLPALNLYDCINPETVLPYEEVVHNLKKELEYV